MDPTATAALPSRRLGPLALAAIFVAASAVTALDYSFFVGDPSLVARREIHQRIFNHTAAEPERFRWLAPLIVEGAIQVFGRGTPFDEAFDRTYAVFYVVAMTAMLWALFAYLRVWFTDEQALIAVLLVASTLRITIRHHDYAPGSFLEPTFFALGLLLILQERRVLLGVLIAIATLNRETAIFLVLLYAVTQPLTKKTLQTTLVFGAIWASVFLGVRYISGPGERYWEIERIWRTNISQPGLWLYNLTAFLGVMWLFAVAGFRRAPAFVRRTALIAPPYIAVVAIWGIWWEVRLLLSLLPIVLPLALSYVTRLRAWMIAGIVMTAVLVNATDYSFLVPLREARVSAHQAIVTRSAPAPERSRVLVPFALEVPIRVLAGTIPYEKAFGRVYAVFYFAALATLLALLVYELSFWFSVEQALVGALLVGSTIRIALRQGEYFDLSSIPLSSVFAPHSLLDPIFVAGTIVLALRDRRWWIAALMVAASLNSETAIGLPFVYCAVKGVSASSVKTTIGYLAIWAVVSALLTSFVGSGELSTTMAQIWGENLSHLPTTTINVALFVGPLWILAGLGVGRAPDVVGRLAWLIPVYVIAVGVFALWWDVRLLMPLYPLLIPLILAALFSPRTAYHAEATT